MGAGGRYKAIPHNSKYRYGERGAADAMPQLPERCLSRKAGIVRCCLRFYQVFTKKHLFCPANWDIIKGLQTALPAMEGNE